VFDIESIKNLEDTQKSNFYRAKVVSLDDPLNLSRVQINIFGLTDDFTWPLEKPEECPLPWCELQFRDGFTTYPNVDDVIWLFFEGGDIFRPIYLGTIYAGLDIETDVGYEKFAAKDDMAFDSMTKSVQAMNASVNFTAVENKDSYIAAIRSKNNTETDKDLILKDTISHYDVATKGNSWSRTFEGFKEAKLTGTKGWLHGVVDPEYGNCPFPKGQPMYPWYELREKDSTSWKSIYGGWTFLTEAELNSGMASFPDNTKRTYMKRYKSWVNWTVSKSLTPHINEPDDKMYANALPKSWNFLPMAPTLYSDPELYSVSYMIDSYGTHKTEMGGYCFIKPSPFATMKIKNRKNYKQSTWLSYDGKSAVELDDNDNYERLQLNFNYGEGGLEFSRAGWHGLRIWTEGAFKIQGWGQVGTGTGKTTSHPCAINAIDTNLHINSNRNLFLGGDKGLSMGSLGLVAIRSKNNAVSITGARGITLQSENGYSTGEGTTDGNAGTHFGSPVIAGNGTAGEGGMNGNMAVMLNATLADATNYFKALNSAILAIKQLASTLKTIPPTPAAVFCGAIKAWAMRIDPILKDLEMGALSPVSIMAASELINIEGAAKGT
jgi:hypothetical protein